ncbi:hypothetical protein ACLF3G_27185 [Falsiroseomonas sp. HC035]|uniref:hypothetical protein n=1 Tax=Falsiroseomonas sp. HC035 TaxID=3390999 RepID=UPI003D31F4BD
MQVEIARRLAEPFGLHQARARMWLSSLGDRGGALFEVVRRRALSMLKASVAMALSRPRVALVGVTALVLFAGGDAVLSAVVTAGDRTASVVEMVATWFFASAMTGASAWGAAGAVVAMAAGIGVPMVASRPADAAPACGPVEVVQGIRVAIPVAAVEGPVAEGSPPRVAFGAAIGAAAGLFIWFALIVFAAPVGIAPAGSFARDSARATIVPVAGWLVAANGEAVVVVDPTAPEHLRWRQMSLVDGATPAMRDLEVLDPAAVGRSVTRCGWWCAPRRSPADEASLAERSGRVRDAWVIGAIESIMRLLGYPPEPDKEAGAGTVRQALDRADRHLAPGQISSLPWDQRRRFTSDALGNLRLMRDRLARQDEEAAFLTSQGPKVSLEAQRDRAAAVVQYRRDLSARLDGLIIRYEELDASHK